MKLIFPPTLLLIFFLCSSALAQNKTVTGTVVVKETQQPMIGVTVLQKGTRNFTTTNLEGRYQIEAPRGSVLEFSFFNIKPMTVTVGDKDTVDVIYKTIYISADKYLNYHYTALEQKELETNLGYAVHEVENKEILLANETNLLQGLAAKNSGLLVSSNSGAAGASTSLRVRGNRSLYGDNSPLIILDGIPIDNNEYGTDHQGYHRSNRAIDINPHDIENATVLKGPAATNLYGNRGANGVILLETKKGGNSEVNISSSVRMDQMNLAPALQSRWALGLPNSNQLNPGLEYTNPESGNFYSWGPLMSSLSYDNNREYPYDPNGDLVPATEGNAVAYDNPDYFFRNSFSFDNNVSVRGGAEKLSYYVSAGDHLQNGIIPGNNFRRSSVRTTFAINPTEKLGIDISAAYTRSGADRQLQGNSPSGVTAGVFGAPISFDVARAYRNPRQALDDRAVYQFDDLSQRSFSPGNFDNPYWSTVLNPMNDQVNRLFGYAGFRFKINEDLSFHYKAGIDYVGENMESSMDPLSSGTNTNGHYSLLNRTAMMFNSDAMIVYRKSLDDVEIHAIAGHNFFSSGLNNTVTDASGFGIGETLNVENAQTVIDTTGSISRNLNGIFAKFNVGYRQLVYVDASVRNDFSSINGNASSQLYPAVSASLMLNELLGFSGSEQFPIGQLRAAWGKAGNDGGELLLNRINGFNTAGLPQRLGMHQGRSLVNYYNPMAASLPGIGNLTPEITTSMEVGADFRFFENRFGIDATYFVQQTTNVILIGQNGGNPIFQNGGAISTTGFEIDFHATPVKKGLLKWNIDANFTQWNNTIDDLGGADPQIMGGFEPTYIQASTGLPYGAMMGTVFARNNAGQLIIDSDGWPMVDTEHKLLGKSTPDWFAGLRNTIQLEGLTISALFDIRGGQQLWNGSELFLRSLGMAKSTEDQREITGFVFDGVLENGETNTIAVDFYDPSLPISENRWLRYGAVGVGEEGVMNASLIRLRELTIGYSIPQDYLVNSSFREVSFYLSGRNLLVKSPYVGMDSETSLFGGAIGGFDLFNVPNTRSYVFTMSFTF